MTTIYSIIESFGRQFWVECNKFQDVSKFKFLIKDIILSQKLGSTCWQLFSIGFENSTVYKEMSNFYRNNFYLLRSPYEQHRRLKKQNESGRRIFFDRVMFITDEKNVQLGKPILKNFRVEGNLLPGIHKKSKLLVFKMRSKKRFKRKMGYRLRSNRIKFINIFQLLSNFSGQILVTESRT